LKSARWLKIVLGFSLCGLVLVKSVSILSAQDTDTPQPNPEQTPPALTINVQPDHYKRTCYPVHALLFDSHYQAYLDAANFRLDENGALLTDYGTNYKNAGWQYVPQTISSFGMTAAYAWCESGDPVALQLAVNQGEWLLRNAQKRGDFVTWLYNFPNPSFFAPSGWTSGLGNGQAIVLLTQLYLFSSDNRYLAMAQAALKSYQVDMKDGGVRSTLEDGSVVFEEIAHPDIPVSFILNGHMIAVDSLAFYADATGDATAAALVKSGMQTVRDHLADFDASSTTTYSLGPIPWGSSRIHYAHGIHIRGLFWMYTRTNDPAFLQYAFIWQRYKWPPDAYRNAVMQETFIQAFPDLKRILYEPDNTTGFILDLRQSQRVRSFSYNMVGPYPSSYDIAVSQDGTTWDTLRSEVTDQHHNLVMLDGVEARYVRWTLGPLVRNNAYYNQVSNGIYHDFLMVGVMRADGDAYWDEPILLVTDGTTDYDDAQWLRDNDPQTSLKLPADAVIYADLRGARQALALKVEAAADSQPITRRVWAEVSDDLQTWTPLIAQEDAQAISLPGQIDLPQFGTNYRYLRLHLDGDAPLTMTEAQISLASP
jgi:hypothetical protein